MRPKEVELKITEVKTKEKLHNINGGTFSDLDNVMVSLRGPSAKHFWDGLERLGERLEELHDEIGLPPPIDNRSN